MRLPKSIFFLIVVHWDQHALAQNQECGQDAWDKFGCPGRKQDDKRYTCRLGVKKYKTIFPDVNAEGLSKGNGAKYCECDEQDVTDGNSGFTGGKCEVRFSRCPDGQVCFNGAPCVKIGDEKEYICGCAYTPNTRVTYVGEHCEYEADDFCDDDSSYDISKSGKWFCTNNGVCRNNESDLEEKCKCEEGYYGLHCEFKDKNSCEAKCENEGYCARGVKDFTHLNDDVQKFFQDYVDDIVEEDDRPVGVDDDDFYTDDFYQEEMKEEIASYCVCPDGWTGKRCELKIDDCGENVCMNGASCRAADIDNTDSASFYCDCTDVDVVDEEGKTKPHAGMSCQRVYTAMCDAPDGYSDNEYFCTNGGECPDKPHMPCVCKNGFSGPRCEFEGEKPPVECALPCQNNGECYFGDASPSRYDDVMDFKTTIKSNTGMHCKCPEGFFGNHCEVKAEVCGIYEHYCQNSGKCIKDDDEWGCDCAEMIHKGTVYAGTNCEHVATSFCKGSGSDKEFFCTNNGKCMSTVYEDTITHPGCECVPPFHGDHCEYEYLNVRNEGNTASKAFLGFMISLFGLLAIFLVVHFYKKSASDPSGRHHPIGIPLEFQLRAADLNNAPDNTMCMGSGYHDENDVEAEIMRNARIN